MREREIEKNAKTRRYPSKEAESHVLFQYLVDTGIFSHLYLMLRDAIFDPHFPNLRVQLEKKTMAQVIKYDLYSEWGHDATLLEKLLQDPRQSKDAASSHNQYILVTPAMKQFDSPLVLGH